MDTQFSVPNPNQIWNYSAEPALPAGLAGTRSYLFFCWKKGLNMVMVEVGKTSTVYAHFVRLLGVE